MFDALLKLFGLQRIPKGCQCDNLTLIGYYYQNHYCDKPEKTYTYTTKVIGCRVCKNVKREALNEYLNISEDMKEKTLEKLRKETYVNYEIMQMRIDAFKYGSKLVEVENIFKEEDI